jgi:predicted aldo/keto reductase-like oxidoreductase
MVEKTHQVTRRSFLKTAAMAAGTALGGFSLSAAQAKVPTQKTFSLKSALPTRVFGKTQYTLPIFGHGGSAMIEQEKHKYGIELIPIEERVKMVRHGYEAGIRYFDTARIYGESERIMGEALHDVREDVYLASKVLVFNRDRVRPSVEESLRQLKTDYLDCVQIHGPSIERLGYEGVMPIHEELVKLREEGLIRFIGLTGHTRFEEMYKMIATGRFDTVLIEYGYFNRGYNTRHSEESLKWREACIAKATEMNMGIVAMKVLGANIFSRGGKKLVPDYPEEKFKELPGAAIRWVLNDPRIHILNLGISRPEDIDSNIAVLTGDLRLRDTDKELLREFSALALQNPEIQEMKVV